MLDDLRNGRRRAATGILGLLALTTAATALAAATWQPLPAPANGRMPVRVETLKDGRIRVGRAGRKAVLDLSRDISGCTGPLYDPTDPHTTRTAGEGAVELEIVDETEKAPYTYLVLLASAPPNCNVQGQCGAGGPDSTLLWLKLAKDLSIAAKAGLSVEDCRAERVLKLPGVVGEDQADAQPLRAKQLPWKGDILQIDVEEGATPVKHRLLYDRQHPEAGLTQVP